jgi:hypothetical protein
VRDYGTYKRWGLRSPGVWTWKSLWNHVSLAFCSSSCTCPCPLPSTMRWYNQEALARACNMLFGCSAFKTVSYKVILPLLSYYNNKKQTNTLLGRKGVCTTMLENTLILSWMLAFHMALRQQFHFCVHTWEIYMPPKKHMRISMQVLLIN